jgi:hypothetical protein
MNGEQVPEIVCTRLAVVQDQDESIDKVEDVKTQKDYESTDDEEDYSALGGIPPLFKAI